MDARLLSYIEFHRKYWKKGVVGNPRQFLFVFLSLSSGNLQPLENVFEDQSNELTVNVGRFESTFELLLVLSPFNLWPAIDEALALNKAKQYSGFQLFACIRRRALKFLPALAHWSLSIDRNSSGFQLCWKRARCLKILICHHEISYISIYLKIFLNLKHGK